MKCICLGIFEKRSWKDREEKKGRKKKGKDITTYNYIIHQSSHENPCKDKLLRDMCRREEAESSSL